MNASEAKSDSDAGPPLPKPSEDSITARPTTSTAARTAEAAQLEAELHALLANGTDDQEEAALDASISLLDKEIAELRVQVAKSLRTKAIVKSQIARAKTAKEQEEKALEVGKEARRQELRRELSDLQKTVEDHKKINMELEKALKE